jgi:hypothetical protein
MQKVLIFCKKKAGFGVGKVKAYSGSDPNGYGSDQIWIDNTAFCLSFHLMFSLIYCSDKILFEPFCSLSLYSTASRRS